jgi:leucyl-tRNA synthetase
MEFLNAWSNKGAVLSLKEVNDYLKLLAPFAPYLTEELYFRLNPKGYKSRGDFSIHSQPWPKYDPKLIEEKKVAIVIQVNGKVRGQMEVESQRAKVKSRIQELARKEANVIKYLEDKKIKKVVFVPGKLINFVVV